MMGVNSSHYMSNTWPSNGGSYNWDEGLLCSWNAGLSPAFSRWGNARRGSWAPRFGRRGGVKMRASDSVFPHWRSIRRAPQALRLQRGLQTLTQASSFIPEHWSDTEMRVLSSASWHCSGVETRLRALRFAFARVVLICLAYEAWTLLSDDLSSVIFRRSTESSLKFSKLHGWLGRVLKYFGLFFFW